MTSYHKQFEFLSFDNNNMELIQEAYIQGDYDECLQLVLDRLCDIKNYFDKGVPSNG